MNEVVIVEGARTPMAEYEGTPGFGLFRDISAIDLGSTAARAALERSGVHPKRVDHVIVGNALQTSNDAIYGARHVGLKAGCPFETPAVTVNRLCGSGIQSIIQASEQIMLGDARFVLAGGMENMSQAPHVVHGLRSGLRFGQSPEMEDLLFAALRDPYCGCMMAETAENLAKKYDVPREEQDEFSYRSHQLGIRATEEDRFRDEIVPVEGKRGRKTVELDHDDHIKPDTSMEALAKLRPAFGEDGTVTAGNASGIVDGAAMLVVADADAAAELDREPLGRVVAWAVVGVDPSYMGIGPAPAIRSALRRADLSLEDIDLFEINEAFAAQYLAVEKELQLERDRVNVNGGAIAIGHPLGATGTRLVQTLLYEMRRREVRRGCASACIGGGQGIAIIVESLT